MLEARKITLGGQEFTIPELPLGVKRVINPVTRRMSLRAIEAKEKGAEAMQAAMSSEENLNDAQIILAAALAFACEDFSIKAYPQLIEREKDKLFMMDIDEGDLLGACMDVAILAGGKRLGEAMEAAKNQTPAPAPTSSPTSTE